MEKKIDSWNLNNLQCHFVNGDQVKLSWAFEAMKVLQHYQSLRTNIESQMSSPRILKLTRERLKSYLEKLELQMAFMAEILAPLGWKHIQDQTFATYLSSHPDKSSLLNNLHYIFRDWVWGEAEILAALEIFKSLVPKNFEWGNTLVLGAGASRLPLEMTQSFDIPKMVLGDINPALMLCVSQLIDKKEFEMVEFPYVPKNLENQALRHLIADQSNATYPAQCHLFDAKNPPFQKGEFKTVMTPWLVDVIDMDINDFLSVLNSLLNIGDHWINFGPLGFDGPLYKDCYSIEEFNHMIEKQGFKIEHQSIEKIDYLNNPASHSSRRENVYTFIAKKIKDIDRVPVKEDEPYSWEQNPDSPILLEGDTQNIHLGYQVNTKILEYINKKLSFNDILAELHQEFSIPLKHGNFLLAQLLDRLSKTLRQNPNT